MKLPQSFCLTRTFVYLVGFVVALAGCGGGGGGNGNVTRNPGGTPTQVNYSVGGKVYGLSGTLVIQNNGGDALTLTGTGNNIVFTFPTTLPDTQSYTVTISQQPTGEQCDIVGDTGPGSQTAITSVSVGCYPNMLLRTTSLSKTVTLSWNDIGASSYDLYYGATGICRPGNTMLCTGPQQLTVSNDITTNIDTATVPGLTNGDNYYFYIVANQIGGFQTSSNVAGARPDSLATDGPVNAIAVGTDGTAYLGGTFSHIGARSGSGVSIDESTYNVRPELSPMVIGQVKAVVADGAGGWYIGGSFTQVGTTNVTNLAHILPGGGVDTGWTPNPDGEVDALTLSGNRLYVGGLFTTIANTNISNLAAFTSDILDTTWLPDPDGQVLALAQSNNVLYVGGDFANISGAADAYLAAIDTGSTGGQKFTFNAILNGPVRALQVAGTILFAGGSFTTVTAGGVPNTANLASYDIDTSGLNGSPGGLKNTIPTSNPGVVDSFALSGDGKTLYFGFKTSVAIQASILNYAYVDRYDIQTGTLTDNWSLISVVNAYTGHLLSTNALALSTDGKTLFAGGDFSNYLNNFPHEIDMAAINTSDGSLNTNFDRSSNGGVVYALAENKGLIYIGGAINIFGGATRSDLAAVGVDQTLSAWAPVAAGSVNALLVDGSTVYIGGQFTKINDQARGNLAAVASDGTLGVWRPTTDGTVYALGLDVPDGNLLYVGGDFAKINTTTNRTRLAAFSTAGSGTLQSDPNYTFTQATITTAPTVYSMAVDLGTIYFGGLFGSVDDPANSNTTGSTLQGLAEIKSSTLQYSWSPDPAGAIMTMLINGSNMYVGGNFTSVGGVNTSNLAVYDLTNNAWQSGWTPSPNGPVNAMAASSGNLFVGGSFTTISGKTVNNLAMFSGNVLQTGTLFNPNGTVNALAANGKTLYVGGSFSNLEGKPHGNFAILTVQ